jgi:hypothetical protein
MNSLQHVEKITWKTDVSLLPCNLHCGKQAQFRVTVREDEVCSVTVCLCAECLQKLSDEPNNMWALLTNTPPAPRGSAAVEAF